MIVPVLGLVSKRGAEPPGTEQPCPVCGAVASSYSGPQSPEEEPWSSGIPFPSSCSSGSGASCCSPLDRSTLPPKHCGLALAGIHHAGPSSLVLLSTAHVPCRRPRLPESLVFVDGDIRAALREVGPAGHPGPGHTGDAKRAWMVGAAAEEAVCPGKWWWFLEDLVALSRASSLWVR